MNYSYWEYKEWFANNDFVVVGSGIVGLSCAIHLKERFPKSKVLVLEKGLLPQGASTKNAGFACFGSISELLSDLKTHSKQEVFQLVKKRWEGLQILRNLLGDKNIDYQQHGGYELFFNETLFEACKNKTEELNQLLFPLFNANVFSTAQNKFNFQNTVPSYLVNKFEAQIDAGKMISQLLKTAYEKGVKVINNTTVLDFSEEANQINITTNQGEVSASKLFFATNGFSKKLLDENIAPARAQVLITSPIKDLHIKGTFHLDEGYYYFRNIHNRVLFGGGRNLDFKGENTTEMECTEQVINKLKDILSNVILPNTNYEVDYHWAGIMGVGDNKEPIIKEVGNNILCAVRLGGMGVALGTMVGKEDAKKVIG